MELERGTGGRRLGDGHAAVGISLWSRDSASHRPRQPRHRAACGQRDPQCEEGWGWLFCLLQEEHPVLCVGVRKTTVKNPSFPGFATQAPPSHPVCQEAELSVCSTAGFQGPLHHFYTHFQGKASCHKVHTIILSLMLTRAPAPGLPSQGAALVSPCPTCPAAGSETAGAPSCSPWNPQSSCHGTRGGGVAARGAREQLNGFLFSAYLPWNRTIIS